MFLFFLSVFWLTNSGFDTSEAGFQYEVAKRFVTTGQISFEQPQLHGVFSVAPNGRTYGSHEFGNTLFLIPAAVIGQGLGAVLTRTGMPGDRIDQLELFIVSFQPGVYTALTLTLLFLILTREYGLTTRQAFLACVALGFGTFFWNYSRSLFDGVLGGLLWTAALYQLLRYRATGRLSAVAIAFALLGLAVATRVTMLIPAGVSMMWLLSVRPRSRWMAGGVALVALMPFALWQAWYNHLRTGGVFLSPVQSPQYVANALDGSVVIGLMGHLVSPGKGLLIFAPLLITSVIVFPRFWSRDRSAGALLLVTGVLWLVVHARLRVWFGSWGWGPRHMFAMLPMLALPGLVYLSALWSVAWSRRLVAVTLAVGGVIAASATVGNFHYRLQLAEQERRSDEPEMVWGAQSQAIDMVVGAGRNLGVIAGLVPPLSVPVLSELNNKVSNRINLWWLTLHYVGVSWIWVLLLGLPLVAIAAVTARRLLT